MDNTIFYELILIYRVKYCKLVYRGEHMHTDLFEEKFDEFLEGKKYDAAQAALFAVVREAFEAGWKAAGQTSSAIAFPASRKR